MISIILLKTYNSLENKRNNNRIIQVKMDRAPKMKMIQHLTKQNLLWKLLKKRNKNKNNNKNKNKITNINNRVMSITVK